jgi:hypothetical protein
LDETVPRASEKNSVMALSFKEYLEIFPSIEDGKHIDLLYTVTDITPQEGTFCINEITRATAMGVFKKLSPEFLEEHSLKLQQWGKVVARDTRYQEIEQSWSKRNDPIVLAAPLVASYNSFFDTKIAAISSTDTPDITYDRFTRTIEFSANLASYDIDLPRLHFTKEMPLSEKIMRITAHELGHAYAIQNNYPNNDKVNHEARIRAIESPIGDSSVALVELENARYDAGHDAAVVSNPSSSAFYFSTNPLHPLAKILYGMQPIERFADIMSNAFMKGYMQERDKMATEKASGKTGDWRDRIRVEAVLTTSADQIPRSERGAALKPRLDAIAASIKPDSCGRG